MVATDDTETTEDTLPTKGGYVPDKVLSFTAGARFAHFRQIEANTSKPTYRIPPRTTLAGLIAGILGFERNEYYSHFQPNTSAIAVVPETDLRTTTDTINGLDTDGSKVAHLEAGGTRTGIKGIPSEATASHRVQTPIEYLRNVKYRVFVGLADDDLYADLRATLQSSAAVYPPSLGRSECLARIKYQGEIPVRPSSEDEVDSVLYDSFGSVQPSVDVSYGRERSPCYMERTDGGGRRTTHFATVTYPTSTGPLATIGDIDTYDVGGYVVDFS